jgi:prepilin-type N-terminal cleavage/methylation domain-containing protein
MRISMNRNGFTLIEMLVVVTLIGILASIALPNFLKAKDKAKEAETKANLHVIQVALERYATDHAGEYPAVLIGGDDRGWRKCEAVTLRDPEDRPPLDPLIQGSYVTDYPRNPFVDDGLTDTIENTGNPETLAYGKGDVRFGYDGTTMGNTLADPRYLWTAPGTLSRLQYTFAPDSVFRANSSLEGGYVNPFYTMGGLPDRSGANAQGRTIRAFWPGQFFYRSTGDLMLRTETDATAITNIWSAGFVSINRYMLGCYGSLRTAGQDIIRLTDINGNAINNQNGQDNGGVYAPIGLFENIPFASPEVFGGGRKGVMPIFPYYTQVNQSREYVYGAPDGYDDGIIMVYTSEQDSSGDY